MELENRTLYKKIEELEKQIQHYKNLQEEFNEIIEMSNDGIFITDHDGKVLRMNRACERIDDVCAEDIVGRYMQELVKQGYYSDSVTLRVLKENRTVSILQTRKDGKEIMATGTPIMRDGEMFRVIVNARDITELNKIKRELIKANYKNRLFQSEIELLRERHNETSDVVSKNNEMKKITDMALKIAKVDSTVLIEGESGVGKGALSKLIHTSSNRKGGPFIKIDCSSIPYNLMESELFGYEKGAFTGANKDGKIGLIELANKGTLFLDEIGELPLNLQAKLLRTIQDREIVRIGGKDPIHVDIRIIAATNRNLEEMVREKAFREDLYYRLNVVPLCIPPLRVRKEDIQPFIMYFIERFNKKYDLQKNLLPDALNCLLEYEWPGNVRELENMIERLVVTSNTNLINIGDIPASVINAISNKIKLFDLNLPISYKEIMDNYEKELLIKVMEGTKSTLEMSKLLDVDVSTIRRKMKKHKIRMNSI